MPTAPIASWIPQQFLTVNGTPLAGGLVYTYEAGTTTPLQTYSSVDLDALSVRTNPIVLGDDGRPEDGLAVYVLPQLYKWAVHDADDVLVYTVDDQGDIGYIFSIYFGRDATTGGDVEHSSPYTVLVTDRLVLVDSGAGAATVNLPSAADYTATLTIKNMGANTVAVTPDGADTIEGIAAAYSIAASASPLFRTVQLASNGVDAWWILGGLGV